MSDDAARRTFERLARTSDRARRAAEASSIHDQHGSHGSSDDYRETIRRATDAVDDVEVAARFVEEVGLDELERAVERSERSVSACATDGRRALEAFRDVRTAASADQFRSRHTTALGRDDVGSGK